MRERRRQRNLRENDPHTLVIERSVSVIDFSPTVVWVAVRHKMWNMNLRRTTSSRAGQTWFSDCRHNARCVRYRDDIHRKLRVDAAPATNAANGLSLVRKTTEAIMREHRSETEDANRHEKDSYDEFEERVRGVGTISSENGTISVLIYEWDTLSRG
jgi:hypothetical protein